MRVLIVEANPELGRVWSEHVARLGMETRLAGDADEASGILREKPVGAIVVDLDLPGAGAMAVADYAAYRRPEARVIFVTAQTFFSDGSIFGMSPNAAAFLSARIPPEDLAAVVEYHARRAVNQP